MVQQEQRAAAMASCNIGPLIGPILGPVIGGVILTRKGSRWGFWIAAIISGCLAALMTLIMRETYAPVILRRKIERLRKETGNNRLRSKLDSGLSCRELLKRSGECPLKLLIFSPICTVTTTVGLVYLGLGIGSLVGIAVYTVDSNRLMKWTNYVVHWIAPAIGLAIIGCGYIYLIDAYSTHAASALAANPVMRSIAGAILPLCWLKIYAVLGLGRGNSLLAFIAVALIPVPFVILRYGEKLRLETPPKNEYYSATEALFLELEGGDNYDSRRPANEVLNGPWP
ncbi:major facilitator superfamily domain-containing protein [Truncatella angustata]|uniref:Major facilitator superfamily domain-containing protein n=1 Tax=Truncatella angustata TaxID=152316 RepID=A0A9P8RKU9_9PEZI|nr:major facilitator superfamily domain-containing protein [Truncatella angustata]KAH6645011.1 major facilitator superfamily domain-containing protein [Truncatella angustata]